MAKKNEWYDVQGDIFQDEKFAKQMNDQLNRQMHIIDTPTVDQLKIAIYNLKSYSELSDDLHDEYANSEFINELAEYYTYLEKRYNMMKKTK
jgi:hypothetical protein